MILKNAKEIKALLSAIKKCKGDVWLMSQDRTEQFNMKSTLSQYIAISELVKDHGNDYELFAQNKEDESVLLHFFFENDEVNK